MELHFGRQNEYFKFAASQALFLFERSVAANNNNNNNSSKMYIKCKAKNKLSLCKDFLLLLLQLVCALSRAAPFQKV